MHFLDYLIIVCLSLLLLSALVATCAFAAYQFSRKFGSGDFPNPRYMHMFKIGAAISGLLLFGWLMSQAFFLRFLQKDIATVLNHYEPGSSSVYVNGSASPDGPELVWLLKHIDHHDTTTTRPSSYPGKQIDIKISNPTDSIVFQLRRDSRTRNEYWIFYNAYRWTSFTHIGKIWSDVLDPY